MPDLPFAASACNLYPFIDPRIALAYHRGFDFRAILLPGLTRVDWSSIDHRPHDAHTLELLSIYSDSNEFLALLALQSWHATFTDYAPDLVHIRYPSAEALLHHRKLARDTLRDCGSPSFFLLEPVS